MNRRQAIFQSLLLPLWFSVFSLFPFPAFTETLLESPVPNAEVARAQFTSGVVNHEPVDQLVSVDGHFSSINYFTELRNLQGRKVTHRWEHNGKVISEVTFNVGGPRWRVYSNKTLDPSMSGKWTVIVLDQSGWPLHASIFEYMPENKTDGTQTP